MPPMSEPNLEILLSYIREHGSRYSPEALKQQMLAAGHDPVLVEQALAIEGEKAAPPAAVRKPVWPLALLVAFANILLLCLTGYFSVKSQFSGDLAWTLLGLLTGLLVVELILGIILLFSPTSRRFGLALLLGLLFDFILAVLGVGGFCLYIMQEGF